MGQIMAEPFPVGAGRLECECLGRYSGFPPDCGCPGSAAKPNRGLFVSLVYRAMDHCVYSIIDPNEVNGYIDHFSDFLVFNAVDTDS
jgi:hypothetical protein